MAEKIIEDIVRPSPIQQRNYAATRKALRNITLRHALNTIRHARAMAQDVDDWEKEEILYNEECKLIEEIKTVY